MLTLGKERLSGRVSVEDIPSGQRWLTLLMEAMTGNRVIRIHYRKYTREEGEVLIEPDAVIKATEEYRYKSDKIQNFVDDCLLAFPGQNTSIKDAYDLFGKWCDLNGFGTENKGNFIDEIKTKNIFSPSGTVNGITVRNVIKGYVINDEIEGFVESF